MKPLDSVTQDPSLLSNARIESTVLDILERVSGTTLVRENPDLALFDKHIIDSFDVMMIIVELSDALQIEISPSEIEHEAWSTPRKIIVFLQDRVNPS